MGLADWFDALDDENRPLLTEREILCNLQAIVKDADNTPVTEVSTKLPQIRDVIDESRSRLLELPLVFSPLRTGRTGSAFAQAYPTIATMLLVWTLSMKPFSLCAWMIPHQRTWPNCAAISCVELTTCRQVFRWGHVRIGGTIRWVFLNSIPP